MDKKTWFYLAVFILLVGGLFAWYGFTPGRYNGLATCITDSGAKFYGAFWCQHCQEQKKIFGKSAKLLPYIECSTPDTKGQLEICKENDIQGYPTWIFKNGNRQSSVMSIEDLAATTSCAFSK